MNVSAEELFENNQKLVYYTLHRYYSFLANDEDAIQEGMLGLWKSCVSYNSDVSRFSTYATTCIVNQIRMYLRNKTKEWKIEQVSLDTLITDDSEATLEDILGSSKDDYEDVDFKITFHKVLNRLSEKHQKILYLLMEGHNQTYVAKSVGCSQPQVSRVLKKFMKKLEVESL